MSRIEIAPSSAAGLQDSGRPTRLACSWTDRCAEGAWLRVAGVLDFATVSQLARTLRERVLGERLIVLDLRELESIDLFGVHAIANAATSARKIGHRLVLLGGAADVDRLFKQAGRLGEVEIGDLKSGEPPAQVLVRIAAREHLS